MSAAGVLVTVGVVWGSLKAGLTETRDDVREIKESIKSFAAVPALLEDTREDVRDIKTRLNAVEAKKVRK